jgi:hypothetical protein
VINLHGNQLSFALDMVAESDAVSLVALKEPRDHHFIVSPMGVEKDVFGKIVKKQPERVTIVHRILKSQPSLCLD